MKVSGAVIYLAPREAKQWARATAREIEFIQSDWAALRWSLGSARILFQRTEAPISSLSEVPQAALQFAKEIRKRTIAGTLICALEVVWLPVGFHKFATGTHNMASLTVRTGCILTIGAMLYMGYQLLARRSTLSSSEESPATPDTYRSELELQRDFHSGAWLWSRVLLMVPGFLLLCIGMAITHPGNILGTAGTAAMLLTLCVLAIPLNLRIARKYQRRIDDLDAIERVGA
jgi:hypothetical protein